MKPLAILYAGAGIAAAAAGAVIAWRVWQHGEDIAQAAATVLQAVNPANPDNVVAQAANKVAQAATGDDSATVGTAWWRLWNPRAAEIERRITDPVRIAKPGNAPGAGAAIDLTALDEWALGGPIAPADTVGGVPITPFFYGAP